MKKLTYLLLLLCFTFISCVDENTKSSEKEIPKTYEDFSISGLTHSSEKKKTPLKLCANASLVNDILKQSKIQLDIGKKALKEATKNGDKKKEMDILFGIVKNQKTIETLKLAFPFLSKRIKIKREKYPAHKGVELLSVEIK